MKAKHIVPSLCRFCNLGRAYGIEVSFTNVKVCSWMYNESWSYRSVLNCFTRKLLHIIRHNLPPFSIFSVYMYMYVYVCICIYVSIYIDILHKQFACLHILKYWFEVYFENNCYILYIYTIYYIHIYIYTIHVYMNVGLYAYYMYIL